MGRYAPGPSPHSCRCRRRHSAGELSGDGKHRWFCLAYFAPNRCRDQPQKRPVVQSHGITLSFHREVADASRELVGPDVTAAVSFESYPRFIKGGFQDYEGLGIKRSTADSKHVPSIRSRLLGNTFPQKVVESLELPGTSGDHSKSREHRGTPRDNATARNNAGQKCGL